MRPDYYNYHPITEEDAIELYADMEPSSVGIALGYGLAPEGIAVDFDVKQTVLSAAEFPQVELSRLSIQLEFGHWFTQGEPLSKFKAGPFSKDGFDPQEFRDYPLRVHCMKNLQPDSFLPAILRFNAQGNLSFVAEVSPSEATHLLFHHDRPRSVEPTRFYSEVASYDCGAAGWFSIHEFDAIADCSEAIQIGGRFHIAAGTRKRLELHRAEAAFQRSLAGTDPLSDLVRYNFMLEHI